ncbi:MAG: hypothetical protein JXB32_20975 [Deltaproteobacteria bacterium]|nr:hypothetical protein [Deltaproteobacteria bacterium]
MRSIVVLVLLSGSLAAGPARAQRSEPCDSCQGCSALLAQPGARAELHADLVHEGTGPCVVVAGEGALFDGLEREIRCTAGGGAVGIRVEGARALVRNVHVLGAGTGIEVAAPDVTLFHAWVEAQDAGIRGDGSAGLRVTRGVVRGGQVGISLGGDAAGACPAGATVRSPGVVIGRTHVEGARVGIAACEALPVIRHSTVVRNEVGVVLGRAAPAEGVPGGEGPDDPCLCRPPLEGLAPGVPVMFVSACPGSEAHKAWLPELTPRGFQAVIRPAGPGEAEATRAFDAAIDRCLPQLTDAVGIPGCVPNYACPADDRTFKVRAAERELARELELDDPEALFAFWESCRDAAAAHYRQGEDCVVHALHDNVICGNTRVDVRSAGGLSGADNTCDTVEGWSDAGVAACGASCGDLPTLPAPPTPRERVERAAAAPTPAPAPEPAPAPPPPPAEPSFAPPRAADAGPEYVFVPRGDRGSRGDTPEPSEGSNTVWLVVGFLLLAAVVVVLAVMSRRRPPSDPG